MPDLACGIRDGLGWPCFALAVGRMVGIVLCGRPCFGFGLGPCFGLGKVERWHWPVAVFQLGQTCALAKNKAPNFRSFHEAKELVLIS